MNIVGMWLMLAIGGIAIGFIGGYITGSMEGAVMGFLAGMLPFVAIMQIISFARQKGFIALYKNLEDDEKYVWVPNKTNKIKLLVMKIKHQGILFRKGLGLFEDKGTEFALGNNLMSFAYPDSAYTVDFKNEHYFSKREKEDDVNDYEDCVKDYLGENKYNEFCKTFRTKAKPDYYDIKNEIDYLIKNKPDKENNGSKMVFGETVDFTNRLKWLKYNYNPISALNATELERITAFKEAMDYKDPEIDKALSRARAVAIVIMAVVVLVVVLSVVDFSKIGGLFGG